MIDLSPKQRVFGMLASLARIVNDSADLNAERNRLAHLIEQSRSWETQLMNVPEPVEEPGPQAGADLIFAKALNALQQLDGLTYAQAAQVLDVAKRAMTDSVERLHAAQVFSPPSLKVLCGQEVTYA